jgi:hypothetical protein
VRGKVVRLALTERPMKILLVVESNTGDVVRVVMERRRTRIAPIAPTDAPIPGRKPQARVGL